MFPTALFFFATAVIAGIVSVEPIGANYAGIAQLVLLTSLLLLAVTTIIALLKDGSVRGR